MCPHVIWLCALWSEEKRREKEEEQESGLFISAPSEERKCLFYMRVWSDEKRNMIPPRITFRDFPHLIIQQLSSCHKKRAEMEEL